MRVLLLVLKVGGGGNSHQQILILVLSCRSAFNFAGVLSLFFLNKMTWQCSDNVNSCIGYCRIFPSRSK